MTCLNDLVDSVAITIDYKEDVSRAKIKRILQAAFASIEELRKQISADKQLINKILDSVKMNRK